MCKHQTKKEEFLYLQRSDKNHAEKSGKFIFCAVQFRKCFTITFICACFFFYMHNFPGEFNILSRPGNFCNTLKVMNNFLNFPKIIFASDKIVHLTCFKFRLRLGSWTVMEFCLYEKQISVYEWNILWKSTLRSTGCNSHAPWNFQCSTAFLDSQTVLCLCIHWLVFM